MSDMLTAAWLYTNDGKNGGKYLAGSWGNIRVYVFPNKAGSKSSHRLVFGERQEQDGQQQAPVQQQTDSPPPLTDDDIPF